MTTRSLDGSHPIPAPGWQRSMRRAIVPGGLALALSINVTTEALAGWVDPRQEDPNRSKPGATAPSFDVFDGAITEAAVTEPAVTEPAVTEAAVTEAAVSEPTLNPSAVRANRVHRTVRVKVKPPARAGRIRRPAPGHATAQTATRGTAPTASVPSRSARGNGGTATRATRTGRRVAAAGAKHRATVRARRLAPTRGHVAVGVSAPASTADTTHAPGTGTISRWSERTARVITFARRQLGRSYRPGGTGPGGFDCSGLAMSAWRTAGVSLPHSSRVQYRASRHISRRALRPGDLVFWGRGSRGRIHHVAVYIGGGRIIHATRPGDVVRVASIRVMGSPDYYGRPG